MRLEFLYKENNSQHFLIKLLKNSNNLTINIHKVEAILLLF